MGSWSVHCGISSLSITSGDKVVLLPLRVNDTHRGYLPYLPSTLPIFGTYDDYGGLEDIQEDANTKLIEEHFGITIQEFVIFFVDGVHTYERDEYQAVKVKLEANGMYGELKDWNFMFIDGEFYDFLSTKPSYETGNLEFGNPDILKLIGFEEAGPSGDSRYSTKYTYGDKTVCADGRSLSEYIFYWDKDDSNYSLSSHIDIPEDKQWIGKCMMVQLWSHLGDTKALELLFGLMGGERQLNTRESDLQTIEFFKKTLNEENDMGDDEKVKIGELVTQLEKRISECTFDGVSILEKYMSDYSKYGDLASALNVFRHNMYCMSGYFKPNVLHMTPQCGEHSSHQEIIEGISKINKARCFDEDE